MTKAVVGEHVICVDPRDGERDALVLTSGFDGRALLTYVQPNSGGSLVRRVDVPHVSKRSAPGHWRRPGEKAEPAASATPVAPVSPAGGAAAGQDGDKGHGGAAPGAQGQPADAGAQASADKTSGGGKGQGGAAPGAKGGSKGGEAGKF